MTWNPEDRPQLIIVQHHLKESLFDDFTNIFGTTHPNLAIDSLWLTQPRAVSIHRSSSQVNQSSHLSFISYLFPWWVTCFSFLLLISLWFLIWFVNALTNAVWGRTSGTFSLTHCWENRLLILTSCLVVMVSLMYIKRLSCLREGTI